MRSEGRVTRGWMIAYYECRISCSGRRIGCWSGRRRGWWGRCLLQSFLLPELCSPILEPDLYEGKERERERKRCRRKVSHKRQTGKRDIDMVHCTVFSVCGIREEGEEEKRRRRREREKEENRKKTKGKPGMKERRRHGVNEWIADERLKRRRRRIEEVEEEARLWIKDPLDMVWYGLLLNTQF